MNPRRHPITIPAIAPPLIELLVVEPGILESEELDIDTMFGDNVVGGKLACDTVKFLV